MVLLVVNDDGRRCAPWLTGPAAAGRASPHENCCARAAAASTVRHEARRGCRRRSVSQAAQADLIVYHEEDRRIPRRSTAVSSLTSALLRPRPRYHPAARIVSARASIVVTGSPGFTHLFHDRPRISMPIRVGQRTPPGLRGAASLRSVRAAEGSRASPGRRTTSERSQSGGGARPHEQLYTMTTTMPPITATRCSDVDLPSRRRPWRPCRPGSPQRRADDAQDDRGDWTSPPPMMRFVR